MSEVMVAGKVFNILDNVPEEYTALSDAISELFYVCGSQKLCGACFQGKLLDYNYMDAVARPNYAVHKDIVLDRRKPSDTSWASHGCCSFCKNLSSQGCVQKPLGCAAWQCPYSMLLLPARVSRFIGVVGSFQAECHTRYDGVFARWLKKRISCEQSTWRRDLFSYFRLAAFENTAFTKRDLEVLTIAARRIKRITNWLQRTGLNKPNWPLIEKITRAEPGVLIDVAKM